MKSICNTIATTLGLSFLYAREDEANIVLDGRTTSSMVLYEIVTGNLELRSNAVWQNNNYTIDFIKPVNEQDTAENNDTTMQLMLSKGIAFLSSFKEQVEAVGTIQWDKVQEGKYDANVIGVRLTINATVDGSVRC